MRVLVVLCLGVVLRAQDAVVEGMPAFRISNGKMTVTVVKQGGAIASVTRDDDPRHRNPLWEPMRMAREAGEKNTFGPSLGHFLCLDGFGGVSKEEQAAGYPFHGEAFLQSFAGTASGAAMRLTTRLPLAMEGVARNLTLLPGRAVLQVDTTVTNELSFDRPVQWAEHATVGSPFLEPGATVIDMDAVKAKSRTYTDQGGGLPHRFASGQDFAWPMVPGVGSAKVDMRLTPGTPAGGHTTQLMDPAREWAWMTVMNMKQHLLIGYLFRQAEFPWVQSWENYPASGKLARGLEFSTQPFDVPRRQVVTENSLFGAPTYRWLPAKSSISSTFYLFVTEVPAGWLKINDVTFENGVITVVSETGSLKI
jgi:hypothetical protein